MHRREFLKTTSAASLLACFPASLAGMERAAAPGKLERRPLGRTGEKLSIIALGGIVVSKLPQATADRFVREAIDHGVNYFDVAPTYGDAQERMGPALMSFRRDVFLACKTTQRGRQGAAAELEHSLLTLQTDHFDLYQLHGLTKTEEVEQAFGPDGAMETFLKAKKEGKTRFLGFSAHSEAAALLAMDKFDFDTVLFPVNFACLLKAGFGPKVIARAQEKKMGILALKILARQKWPEQGMRQEHPKCWYQPITDPTEQELAFRFTLSQPITAAVPPGDEGIYPRALELAHRFAPIKPDEVDRLRTLAAGLNPIFGPTPA